MEFNELVKVRRSVRSYKDEVISEADIKEIIEWLYMHHLGVILKQVDIM